MCRRVEARRWVRVCEGAGRERGVWRERCGVIQRIGWVCDGEWWCEGGGGGVAKMRSR